MSFKRLEKNYKDRQKRSNLSVISDPENKLDKQKLKHRKPYKKYNLHVEMADHFLRKILMRKILHRTNYCS